MSLIRNMGAGLAGSSAYKVNVSGPFGGGDKKQGLPGLTNRRVSAIRTIVIRASGNSRQIFIINQLGGVGRYRSQFIPTADGVHNSRRVMAIRYNRSRNWGMKLG